MTPVRKAMPVAGSTGRRLRADAQLNHDLLLESATAAFARDGAHASLKAIAENAGVGIGTLYRRFPTRESLVWGIYRGEVDRICAVVPDLLAQSAPVDALRAWLEAFLDLLSSKQGMAEALRAALATDDVQRLQTRGLLTAAIATLLAAGAADGTFRSNVDALDVLMAVGGTALIAGGPDQHNQAGRLLDLLMDALVSSPGLRRS